jgi:hypothetical protein
MWFTLNAAPGAFPTTDELVEICGSLTGLPTFFHGNSGRSYARMKKAARNAFADYRRSEGTGQFSARRRLRDLRSGREHR